MKLFYLNQGPTIRSLAWRLKIKNGDFGLSPLEKKDIEMGTWAMQAQIWSLITTMYRSILGLNHIIFFNFSLIFLHFYVNN